MVRLLYLAFFLSGVAGLVYETIWSRYLSLFLGTSAYAQVLVLTIFLGGLSLGAFLVGQRTERIRRPLLAYAVAEGLVGLAGLLFHPVFVAVTGWAYEDLFPHLAAPAASAVVRWGLAGALILPQSVLLGTTFPLMSAALLRREPRRPGRTLALLYFANSLGAAVGALLTGFVLVARGGLPGTLVVAGILGLVVAGAAWAVSHLEEGRDSSRALTEPAALPRETPAGPGARLRRGLLAVAFGTALASFIYEIVWIRMLSLALGSTTHAFELMLSAFILGLAVGALWIRRRADGFRDPLRALATIQWCMGLAALATLRIYTGSFQWLSSLSEALQPTAAGYAAYNLLRYGAALGVMLPATFCAGMTLPLITRILAVSGQGERAVGRVYAANTVGSIVGAALAGLVLLPLLGLESLLTVGAGLDMLLGVGVLLLAPAGHAALGRLRRVGVAAAGAAILVGLFGMRLDRAAVTRDGSRDDRRDGAGQKLLYYKDGRTATVNVSHAGGRRWIATNGKTDASLHDWLLRPDTVAEPRPLETDEVTQLLLALLPLAYHPEARRAAVVGVGSGMTSHFLLGSPTLEDVVTIEIEPAMIEGAREFYPANRRVFDDPRSSFLVDDARAVLAARPGRFDLIVSEPSNPWISGISSLFTRNFYARVRERLAPGGVFCQWLQVYSIDEELVLGVLAAVHREFPSYRVYRSTHDLLIVATREPELPAPDWSVLDRPGTRADLAAVRPVTPSTLEALAVADRDLLAPLLEGWTRWNSDFHPVLDLGAERARFLGEDAFDFLHLGTGPLELASLFLPGPRGPQGGAAPFPEIAQVEGRHLESALREALETGRVPADPRVADRLYQVQRFRRAMAPGRAPASWVRWMREAEQVARFLHEGRAGQADPVLFDALDRYAEEAGAPDGARRALTFLRAAYGWDLVTVATSGRALLDAEARGGGGWIPDAVLLHALVPAQLATGRVAEARATFAVLRERLPAVADLRLLLLEAHVEAAASRDAG